MQNKILVICIVNVLFIFLYYILMRLRNSKKIDMRTWDNGFEFYSSLSESDKEKYWKEDTKVVKVFLLILFAFIEIAMIVYTCSSDSFYWIIVLVFGIIIASVTAIILNLNVQKKFK